MAAPPEILTSKTYQLIYALPLLFPSTILLFAGTFLMLDRTRSFVPLGDTATTDDIMGVPKPGADQQGIFGMLNGMKGAGGFSEWEKLLRGGVTSAPAKLTRPVPIHSTNSGLARVIKHWRLEGGLGGLLMGFVIGLHLMMTLSLYVAQRDKHLISPIPFLVLCFILGTLFALLTGRFRWAATLLTSISGSYALSSLFALSFHSTTHINLILFLIFSTLLLIAPLLSLLPSLRFEDHIHSALHWSSRISSSAIGMLGFFEAIAILAKVPLWDVAVSAVWNGVIEGGNKSTRTMSVVGWFLVLIGIGTDYALFKLLGPCKDQEWDRYLAGYMDNLPDRAGHFEAPTSLWSRLTRLFKKSDDSEPLDIPGGYCSSDNESTNKPAFFHRHSPTRYKLRHKHDRERPPKVKFEINYEIEETPTPVPVPVLGKYEGLPVKGTLPHLYYPRFPRPRLPETPSSSSGKSDDTLLDQPLTPTWTLEKYEEQDISDGKKVDGGWKPAFLEKGAPGPGA